MNLKDGNYTQWSSNSCDNSDLEEYEARLYSMVHHSSETYADPTPNRTADNGSSEARPKLPEFYVESPPTFHRSSKTKASRFDLVNEIIDITGNNDTRPAATKRNMSSKKSSPPKTASLYFRNLTKSLNNVQYLQAVETRPPAVTAKKGNASSTLVNFTFAETRDKPIFKLDDRLFPGAPRNASKEEFELSHRLFSNRPKEVVVDRDRHSHRFNQLPTVPLPSVPIDNQNMSKKQRKRMVKAKRKMDAVRQVAPPSLVAPLLPVIALVTNLNSLLRQTPSSSTPVDLCDDPVEVLIDSKEIINLEPTIDVTEIINLDSDSDSADSIVVITPPVRTPPPVIALSDDEDTHPLHPLLETLHTENSFDFLDSSDEPDQLSKSRVSVFTHLISNSGSKESLLDDRLFHRLTESEVGVSLMPADNTATNQQLDQVPEVDSSVSNDMPPVKPPTSLIALSTERQKQQMAKVDTQQKQQIAKVDTTGVREKQQIAKVDIVGVREKQQVTKGDIQQKQQIAKMDTVGVWEKQQVAKVVVDVDISSESAESASNPGQEVQMISAGQNTIVLNVLDNSEINDFLNRASLSFESPAVGKRKRGCGDEGGGPSPKKKKRKRGKKAREKARHQLQEFLQTRSGMGSLLYTKIEGDYAIPRDELRPRHPTRWTREMRHFYRDSWGGENFDVQAVQRTMSGEQALWRITWEDRRGPMPDTGRYRRQRCYNCSRFGHPANTCPEPHRITKCHMCGEQGHREPTCPNKICLQCSRPTTKFSNGCWECQHVPHALCTKCVWKHDPAVPCMDVRRNPVTPGSVRPETESKRSRLGNRSLDEGSKRDRYVQHNINRRKSRDSYSPHKPAGSSAYWKHTHRRSRP